MGESDFAVLRSQCFAGNGGVVPAGSDPVEEAYTIGAVKVYEDL